MTSASAGDGLVDDKAITGALLSAAGLITLEVMRHVLNRNGPMIERRKVAIDEHKSLREALDQSWNRIDKLEVTVKELRDEKEASDKRADDCDDRARRLMQKIEEMERQIAQVKQVQEQQDGEHK